MTDSLKVCIVGAGVSGLAALKELVEEGHRVVCFERAPRMGGVFTSGIAYNQMQLTVSQYFMAFSSFPPPLGQPRIHWTRDEYVQYLEQFCAHFDLLRHVQFGTTVGPIQRTSDGFVVSYERAGETKSERFDAVAICSGAYRPDAPQHPMIRGLDEFTGTVVHSSSYAGPEPFRGKRVVCIGMGETSADVTKHISEVAAECWLSIRNYPNLIARRPYGNGDTNDAYTSRLALHLPSEVRSRHFEALKQTDRESADPRRRLVADWWRKSGGFGRALQKNDDFVENVLDGRLRVLPHGVERVAGNVVHFVNGTQIEADAIVLCTGYEESTIPSGWVDGMDGTDVRSLFKHAFHPDFGPRLCFIGWARPFQGGLPACSEMVARYFALLCSGKRELPAGTALTDAIASDAESETRQFNKSPRVRTLVDYMHFVEAVAALVDCKPRIEDYLGDPAFLYKLLCGSNVACCYRLRGPGADPEMARTVIMSLPVLPAAVPDPATAPLALAGRVDPAAIPAIMEIVARGSAAGAVTPIP